MTRQLRNTAEFEVMMSEIDAKMVRDRVPVASRQLTALSEAAKFLQMELRGFPRKPVPTPGVYTSEDVPGHIFDWIQRRYGEALKVDLANGYAVFFLRGDPWL